MDKHIDLIVPDDTRIVSVTIFREQPNPDDPEITMTSAVARCFLPFDELVGYNVDTEEEIYE